MRKGIDISESPVRPSSPGRARRNISRTKSRGSAIPCPQMHGSRASSGPDAAKRKIDPQAHRAARLGHSMLPMLLGLPAHDQKGVVLQIQSQGSDPPRSRTQAKTSGRPEAKRRNHRLSAQFRLIVAVPTHRIVASTVGIEENGVETFSGQGFERATHIAEPIKPRQRLIGLPRVTIAGSGIPIPCREPRAVHAPTGDPHRVLRPAGVAPDLFQKPVRPHRAQTRRPQS